MFSQTQLFYLRAKAAHRSRKGKDRGRIERGGSVDFLLTKPTGKSVIITTVKENQSHLITICTVGWMPELGFSEGNKEYMAEMKQHIPPVMNQ